MCLIRKGVEWREVDMILSDRQILKEMEEKRIVIDPFHRENLGPNSYDIHLGKVLATYDDEVIDAKKDNPVTYQDIPPQGLILRPGELYLGVTEEYTENHKHVPFLEGKSSAGRLGIDIHATAGKGDVGFCNYWTLEISCKRPVRIYSGMPIGQLIYFEVQGQVERPYAHKHSAKYHLNVGPRPVPSMMWKNSF